MQFGALATAMMAVFFGAQSASAQEEGAFWTRSDKSMSDYISEGWTVSSHGRQLYSNGEEFSVTLSLRNKSVMCFIWMPKTGKKGVTNYCRLLN